METTARKSIKDLKNKSIVSYLKSQGHQPKSTTEKRYTYHSPIRQDNDPSFNVDPIKNLWYDHGAGIGGDIIDLVCAMHQVSKGEACKILDNSQLAKFTVPSGLKEKEPSIIIKHTQELQNKALLQYLESRGIDPETAKPYVHEAYYSCTDKSKQYFALAFPNDKGGCELRNKYFKGGTSPKYITTIEGQNPNALNIFEGFFDFLSALQYFRTPKPTNTTIVLNTLANLPYIEMIIKSANRVSLFLDNDNAGGNAVSKIAGWNSKVSNQAKVIYPNSKDFNAHLL